MLMAGHLRRVARRSALLALGAIVLARPAAAQELEPGAYTVSPVGINVLNLGYVFNSGDVNFDPSLPVEDASATVHTGTFSLLRSMALAGRSATALVALPIVGGHVEGVYLGQPTQVDRTGPGDLRIRVGVNLYGEPARRMPEFAKTARSKTNIGASVMVVAPTGQYSSQRVINLGTNRWAFKPEGAIIRNHRVWMFEIYGGAWIFTSNDNYVNGHRRTQAPIGSVQFSLRRTFQRGLWISANANFYAGGRSSVDDLAKQDLQTNSRVGTTVSIPLSRRNAIRFAASKGAYTTIGANFLGVSASFQQIF